MLSPKEFSEYLIHSKLSSGKDFTLSLVKLLLNSVQSIQTVPTEIELV